ncbi:MAG: sulfurtransferase FdhD, partial [Chromatiales bacterium]|nr:sulfurtransferase FdhD [Chromatiales bacterium]
MDKHPPGSQSSVRVPVKRADDNHYSDDSDWLVTEEPLEIRLCHYTNDSRQTHSVSVTMRTPGADFDLAAGFLLTEGIIRNPSDIHSMGYTTDQNTDEPSQNIVVVNLTPETSFDITKLQRNFYATSSCGVCGKASLEALTFESFYAVNGE